MNSYQKQLICSESDEEKKVIATYSQLCGVPKLHGREYRVFLMGWRLAFIAMAELSKAKKELGGKFQQGGKL